MGSSKKKPQTQSSSVRFTEEDEKILKAVGAKLGLSRAAVLRLAMRKLAESEGLK